MQDGLTPECVVCGGVVDLADHLERLNTHHDLAELHRDLVGLGITPTVFCDDCRTDPDRVKGLDAKGKEELRRRMLLEGLMLQRIAEDREK
jgi:hypothetical protein